jgi:tetratricopeptide (TPR) repeat protein
MGHTVAGRIRLIATLGLVLAAVTTMVFARACANGFVNYDDEFFVSDNPVVQTGLTPASIWWSATALFGFWHPLTWWSLQLDFDLYGLDPRGYHLTNVLLHTAGTVMLFWALTQLTGAIWPGAIAAALFALHPLRVESVAWVAERKDVLSGLFFALVLSGYARYARRPGFARSAGVAGALALGLMAKSMLVTVPCLLLLLDYWPLRRMTLGGGADPDAPTRGPPAAARAAPWWLVLEKAPLLVLCGASAILTVAAEQRLGALPSLTTIPLVARLGHALDAYLGYLVKALWPVGLAAFYPTQADLGFLWPHATAMIVLLGITTSVLVLGRRHPYLPVGWFWYAGTLFPVSGIIQVGLHAMADRYTYLPCIGLLMMVVWGAAELGSRSDAIRCVLCGVGAASLVACAAGTWVQIGYWHDSVRLWERALAVTPDNGVTRSHLGLAYKQAGRLEDAIWEYKRAIQLDPNYEPAHNNLGVALAMLHRPDEAILEFQEAVRLQPDHGATHANLGRLLAETGKLDEAVPHLEQGLAAEPSNSDRAHNLAVALSARAGRAESMGRLSDAARDLRRASELQPEVAQYVYDLAHDLVKLGQVSEARSLYARALELDPRWVLSANRLAWRLATSADQGVRNAAEAVRLAEQVCEATDYREPRCLDTLAAAYAKAGNFEQARSTARKALFLLGGMQPEYASAVRSRLALYESGRPFRAPS